MTPLKKTYVSLLVISSSMSLDELSSAFGRAHSSGSHDKGEVRADSEQWSQTVWRFDSDAH